MSENIEQLIEKQKPKLGEQRISIALYWDNKLKRYSLYHPSFKGVSPAVELNFNLTVLNQDEPDTLILFGELEPEANMLKVVQETAAKFIKPLEALRELPPQEIT